MAFPTGWTRKCALVIQHGQVPSDQTGFPVLITAACLPNEMVTTGNPNAAQSNGGDIRFSSDSAGASQLACEVVAWTQNANPALSTAEIWVPVNVLAASDVTIYVWYSAGGGQSQPAANAAFGSYAVWTGGGSFAAVYHLPDGTTLTANSAVNAANVGTITACTAVAGKIDGAASFNGSTTQIDLGSNLNNSFELAYECWINAASLTAAYSAIVNEDESVLAQKVFALLVKSNGKLACYTVNSSGTSINYDGTGSHTLVTGTWYHIAMSYSSAAGLVGYVNGAVDGTAAANGVLHSFSVKTFIGNSTNAGRHFSGVIDEVRVSTVALPGSWIATEYNNQSSPATFVIAGSPSGGGGGGGGGGGTAGGMLGGEPGFRWFGR